jgi:hypothetical protein
MYSQEEIKAVLGVLADHEQEARKDENEDTADCFLKAYQLIENAYIKAEETNCSHCEDILEYECDTCPYCKPNKDVEIAEMRIDIQSGN